MEKPSIIQMNIDRYRSMLSGNLDADQRARVEQLLTEANANLTSATSRSGRGIEPEG
jgi:hypothetical protein